MIDYEPQHLAQLINAVESSFDCVTGEPRAFTNDPPLLLPTDQVTTEWIERQVAQYRTEVECKNLKRAEEHAQRLAVNGVRLIVSGASVSWQRDQEASEPDLPRYAHLKLPRYAYFVLALGSKDTDARPLVTALWNQFKVLHELTGEEKPRLLWRMRPHIDTHVSTQELAEFVNMKADLPPEQVMALMIRARLAVPALHGDNGLLRLEVADKLLYLKREGAIVHMLAAHGTVHR